MAANTSAYKVRKFDKRTTMTLKNVATKEFKVRVVIASFLFGLAAWVLGTGIDIDAQPKG